MSASHGNTPAAWTAVSIMFVGFLISGIALPIEQPWLFYVGLVVVLLGAVVGKIMSMMGMGSSVTYKDHRDADYDHAERSAAATSATPAAGEPAHEPAAGALSEHEPQDQRDRA